MYLGYSKTTLLPWTGYIYVRPGVPGRYIFLRTRYIHYYIIPHTFNPHNVKKNPHEEGKKTCVLKKNLKKNSPQLDTDVRHRAVKKKTVKKAQK
jgi:hypothetical protein